MSSAYAFLLPSTLVIFGVGFWIIWGVWKIRPALFWGIAYLLWAACQFLQVINSLHLHKIALTILAQTLILLSIFFQMHGLQDYVGESKIALRIRLVICLGAVGITLWLILPPPNSEALLSLRLALRLTLTGVALAAMQRHLSNAMNKIVFAIVVITTIAITIVAIGMIAGWHSDPSSASQDTFALWGQVIGNGVAIVFALTMLGGTIFNIAQHYRDQALSDPLSGLPNRRRFEDFQRKEWHRALNACQPLSLLMIDIDLFKTFNDTYGHPAGDSCLITVAQVIRANLRECDLCARLGGEEFVAVLPVTTEMGAKIVAENLCRAIRLAAIPHKNNPLGIVTVSIGVASAVPLGSDSGRLMAAADTGLYQAKVNGRNRVEVSC
jgi:diguanylate cyclase (GGDEF)-like protein